MPSKERIVDIPLDSWRKVEPRLPAADYEPLSDSGSRFSELSATLDSSLNKPAAAAAPVAPAASDAFRVPGQLRTRSMPHTAQPSLVSDLGKVKSSVDEKAKTKPEREMAYETEAALYGLGADVIKAGAGIYNANMTIKAETNRKLGQIARDYSDRQFVRDYERILSTRDQTRRNLGMIQSTNAQAGKVLAGGQQQLFLRDPNTGLLI